MPTTNPFASEARSADQLVGRSLELRRTAELLTREGERLVITGVPGVGKSALLRVATAESEAAVALASFVGVSVVADATTRLLHGIARDLATRRGEALTAVAKGLGSAVTVDVDPRSGIILPTLAPEERRAAAEEQLRMLGRVLGLFEAIADAWRGPVSLAIDDADELLRVGGEAAGEVLGEAMRRSSRLTFVATVGASEKPAAFAGLPELSLAPLPPNELAEWIDRRFRMHGVKPQRTGETIVRLAGSSVDAALQLSRLCFDEVRQLGFARDEHVRAALESAVKSVAPLAAAIWRGLTAHQQNVLRALALAPTGLTTSATRHRFSLGDTGTTHNSAQLLVRKAIIRRAERGYEFTSPFVRRWVATRALADAGVFGDFGRD